MEAGETPVVRGCEIWSPLASTALADFKVEDSGTCVRAHQEHHQHPHLATCDYITKTRITTPNMSLYKTNGNMLNFSI